MKRLRPAAALLATLLSGPALCPAEAQQSTRNDLVIGLTQLRRELVVAVAKVGAERSVQMPAGTDIFKLITQYCGSANARRYYLPLFLAANAANPDIKSGKTVTTQDALFAIPACVFADEKPVVVVN